MLAFHKIIRQKNSSGFTLIELLVVVTLTVIVMLGAASLFFATLVGNSRKSVVSQIKNEGDYATSQLEFKLRNAVALAADPFYPTAAQCTQGMQRITLRNVDESTTTICNTADGNCGNQKIGQVTMYKNGANQQYLTSTAVTAAPASLRFDCYASNNGTIYVAISLTLTKTAADYVTATPVTQLFQTSATIRSSAN